MFFKCCDIKKVNNLKSKVIICKTASKTAFYIFNLKLSVALCIFGNIHVTLKQRLYFSPHKFKDECKGLRLILPLLSFGEKSWWFGPGAEGAFCPGHRCWVSWLLVRHGSP